MQNKPKIFVLQLKEVVYTAMFILLAILFVLLVIWMFSSKDSQETTTTPTENTTTTDKTAAADKTKNYTSGIYHSCITLNDTPLELEVAVDSTNIKSIHFANLSDSISTLYPFLEECVENLEEQICLASSLDEITYPEDQQYTSMILMEGIKGALRKAQ